MAYLEVKRKSRIKWWLWLIIIIVVVAVLAFCYQRYYQGSASAAIVSPAKTTAYSPPATAPAKESITLN